MCLESPDSVWQLRQIYENLDENVEHMYQLKEHIAEGLSEIEDIRINGMPLREGAPQILSISVMGVRSEVLLHALEDKGIYISAGSACSSHKRKPSATLSCNGNVERPDRKYSTFKFL